eukprot:gene10558-2682_t
MSFVGGFAAMDGVRILYFVRQAGRQARVFVSDGLVADHTRYSRHWMTLMHDVANM